jgi:hypothetical protein
MHCNLLRHYYTFPCVVCDSASEDDVVVFDDDKRPRKEQEDDASDYNDIATKQRPHRQRLVLVRNLGPLELPPDPHPPSQILEA